MRAPLVGVVCLHVGCGFDPYERCGPAVAGEVPVKGAALQLGAGIARDL